MPRYLIQATYTATAAAAFVSNPQDRVPGVRTIVESLGGKLDSFEFCLGEYDVVLLVTLPDDTTATAFSLAVNAAGHLKSSRATRLMSGEDFLAAQKLAQGTSYQAPTPA